MGTKSNSNFTFSSISITYSVIDPRDPAPISWSASSARAILGESNSLPTLTNTEDLAVSYSSSNTSAATINSSTGEITLVAKGNTTISATYTSPNAQATYRTTTVSYELTVTNLAAVIDKDWNFTSDTETFTGSSLNTTIDNLEIVNGTFDDRSKTFTNADASTIDLTRKLAINAGSSNYLHFAVSGPCKIASYVYGNGSSRKIGVYAGSISGTELLKEDVGNKTPEVHTATYSGTDATDIYIYNPGSNALEIFRILVTPLKCGTPTFSPASGSIEEGSTVTITSTDATSIKYAWTASGTDTPESWTTVTATENAIEVTAPLSADNTPQLHAYGIADGYTDGDAADVTYTITGVQPNTAPTISIASSVDAAVNKGASVTLTATMTGKPAPSIQWYSNTENNTSGTIIEGATEETYSPSTAAAGTIYYYAKATNNFDEEDHVTTSNVVSVIVNPSTACELTNIQFSNSAYGAIGTLSEGAATIEVPYMKGQSAPSVNESSIVISADASYTLVGNTLTVTAEDGTTTGTYTITKTAITPLEVTDDIAKIAFDAVPTWIYAHYGYDSNKGVKIAKNDNEAGGIRRISLGNTRMYLFVGAAKTIKLTSGTGKNKSIKVYRNGVELAAPTATATQNNAIDIALDPSAPCMIMIENRSGSGGGDGGFTHYAITAPADEEAVSVKIAASGKSTFSSPYGLDFSNVSGLTAYKVSEITSEAVTLASVSEAAGGTGLMLVGTGGETYDIPVKSTAAAVTGNKLQASVQPTSVAAESAYILKSGEFHLVTNASTVPASKAYINKEDVPGSASNILGFIIDDSQTETDGIKNINLSFFNNGEVYNLAGQRVSTPKKGLYIVNGKKVIIK